MRTVALWWALLAASPAFANPIDRFLQGVADSEAVIVVPRLGAWVGPVASALRRLRAAPGLEGLFDAQAVPAALLDLELHTRNGLDLEGPLLYAFGNAPVLRLPIVDAGRVPAYLKAVLQLDATPGTVGGRAGYQTAEGVALFSDGGLYGARQSADLASFLGPGGPGGPSLKQCPRPPGEADLFALWRASPYRACLTARLDAGRLEVRVRFGPSPLPRAWLDDGPNTVARRVPPTATGAVTLSPTPFILQRGAAAMNAPEVFQAVRALDGHLAAWVGARLGHLTLAAGVRDADALHAALTKGIAALPAAVVVTPEGTGWHLRWSGAAVGGLPVISEAWIAFSAGALIVTTHKPDLDPPKAPIAAEPGVIALWNIVGGAPHDGQAFVDGLRPLLGDDAQTARPYLRAAAWLAGHVGRFEARLLRDGDQLELQMVVGLL